MVEHASVHSSVHEVRDHFAPLRAQGKRLVTTNGCFDLLHAGHIQYLAQAAALGGILVVGINCDAVVRRLKGAGRPLQTEQDRALIIASLRMVDASFIFTEDDPRAFLDVLKPDIHVKGGDYPDDIIERSTVEKNGGTVRILPFLPGHSTTGLIRNMG